MTLSQSYIIIFPTKHYKWRYFCIMKVLEKTNEIILSRKEYEALIERIEDLEDVLAYDKAKAEDDGTRIPFEQFLEELKEKGLWDGKR